MNFKLQCKFFITFILYISLLGQQNVAAQDTIKRWSLNLQLTHFIAKKQGPNKSFIPINPGIEILYKYPLSSKISVSTGVNYSFSKWSSSMGIKSNWRRFAHEFYVPVVFEQLIGRKLFIILGSYTGLLVKGKEQYHDVMAIRDWIDVTKHSNYSESSRFTWDLYLGTGFLLKGYPKHQIILEPFIKYKIKDNWMGEVRTKTCFGLNIKFKT